MVTEDYVSLKTAKLLKEKGFDEKAKSYFTDDGLAGYMFGTGQKSNSELEDCFYSRPTLQMATKWLREVHKLYMYTAFDGMEEVWFSRIYDKGKHLKDLDDFNTYEEACEAGIRYCLEELI